jgi:hypothetical protein
MQGLGALPLETFCISCDGFFRDRVSGTICLWLTSNHHPTDLCLAVARIIGVSHWCMASRIYLKWVIMQGKEMYNMLSSHNKGGI